MQVSRNTEQNRFHQTGMSERAETILIYHAVASCRVELQTYVHRHNLFSKAGQNTKDVMQT